MDTVDVYEVLVKQHEQMLFAYVLGWVRDASLAEEVAQEALVTGFRKLHTLKNKERFAPWLRTIARNLAYAALRRRNREIVLEPAVIEGMEEIFATLDRPDPASETWEERARILEHCLENLPEKLRDVCRLHYYDDQPVKQINEALKLGIDAIKKRLERARDAIRSCIEKRMNLEELQ
jgi:RNA polymerase sigma-70 factor (ECF subfamily)